MLLILIENWAHSKLFRGNVLPNQLKISIGNNFPICCWKAVFPCLPGKGFLTLTNPFHLRWYSGCEIKWKFHWFVARDGTQKVILKNTFRIKTKEICRLINKLIYLSDNYNFKNLLSLAIAIICNRDEFVCVPVYSKKLNRFSFT